MIFFCNRRALILICLILAFTGCSVLNSPADKNDSSTPAAFTTVRSPDPRYLDFDDIKIPGELAVDRSDSVLTQAGGISSGILVLNGSVESRSLVNYFEGQMIEDGWVAAAQVRAPRQILMFQKIDKTCLISITESYFQTRVEIWVAPALATSVGGGGLLSGE